MSRLLIVAVVTLGCSFFIVVYLKFESLNERIDALESGGTGKLGKQGKQRRRELSNARLRTRLEQMESDIRKRFKEYDSTLAMISRRLQNASNSIEENRLLLSDSQKQLTSQKLLLLKSRRSLIDYRRQHNISEQSHAKKQ